MSKKKVLKCEDCDKVNETVSETVDPYWEAVMDKKISIVVCDDCYNLRNEEV